MKATIHNIYNYIINSTRPIVLRNDMGELSDYIYQKYNIPREIILDILSGRTEEAEATSSQLVIFALIDGLHEQGIINKTVNDYFEADDIKKLSLTKYKETKLEFPLIIDAIRVDDDFWVGAADVNWFMLLRDANKIKYNPEIQRTMRTVKRGNQEYLEINTNQKAIKGIIQLYRERMYIPNAITLNISDDSDPDFYYDDDNKELVIKSIDHFDILDGYNRYYGMSQQKNIEPDFNTNFVLQITNFSYPRGQQYIHQQDLKIKMKKVDSASLNGTAPENQVCISLNSDSIWSGQIRRNGGNINFPILAAVVWRYYFSEYGVLKLPRSKIVAITEEIQNKIKIITKKYPEYMDKKLSFPEIAIIMYVVRYGMDDNSQIEKYIQQIPNAVEKAELSENKSYWFAQSERILRPKTVKFISTLFQ